MNSEPLKNPPIKTIEVTFHVFLDNNGQNNNYQDTQEGRSRLISMLNHVNRIFSGEWGPSNPVHGVVELPNRDTRIRFSLGNNNERIYFYRNTTQNQGWNSSTFYNYVNSIDPSRVSKLNVFFTAGYYQGRVQQQNITITNAGSGYTTAPTVTFSHGGATATAQIRRGRLTNITVTNGGSYNGFNPPQITITGGGGSGASARVTKLAGGATGYANMPSTTLSLNHHVVMLHCHESNDWVYGHILAHEFGHNLDLQHTYCGGGASVICCTGTCTQNCTQNCNNNEYLSDIFGECPGSCPHLAIWASPFDNTLPNASKITNNVMGGSSSQNYFSPMQVGQMHRALSLKSVRKYVDPNAIATTPFVVSNSQVWDFNLKLYQPLTVTSGATLTISNIYELPYNSSVTVSNNAAIVVSGSLQLNDNNLIIVRSGSTLQIKNGAELKVTGTGRVEVESGGYICVENGAIVNLQNPHSVINLMPGYSIGVNTATVPNPGTCRSASTINVTGNGSVNTFTSNTFVQNETFRTHRYITGSNIRAGRAVTNTKPQGDVVINSGAHVIFDAHYNVDLEAGFEVKLGGQFEIR